MAIRDKWLPYHDNLAAFAVYGTVPSSRRISLKTASLQACENRGGLFLLETVDPWTVLAMRHRFSSSGPEIPTITRASQVKVTDVHALISF